MKIYITPAGKTACLIDDFLKTPFDEYRFDMAVVLCSSGHRSAILKKTEGYTTAVIEMQNPYFGSLDYLHIVRRVVSAVVSLSQDSPEHIIINSSGGTEKMSSIIKDVYSILNLRYTCSHVFGIYNTELKEVIFTECPKINSTEILNDQLRSLDLISKTRELEYCEHLDKHDKSSR